MEKKFVSVVLYLHNDSNDVENFLESVLPVIKDSFEQFEVVCVDDACTDDTVDKIREFVNGTAYEQRVSIVHMGFYQGLESAMNAGRDVAIGDFVYEFDSALVDFEAKLVFDIYEKLLEGFDIVSASGKKCDGFMSRLFYSLYNKSNRGNGNIGHESFRILSRRAINRIKSIGRFIPYRKAVYANSGLKSTKVEYVSLKKDTKNVRSKISFYQKSALALDAFIYFTNLMEKVSAIICGIFLLFTIGMVVYTIADYFVERSLVEGWASTMCFMSVGFFGVFALLTIILKYMSVLINLVYRQHKYLVSDIEKF